MSLQHLPIQNASLYDYMMDKTMRPTYEIKALMKGASDCVCRKNGSPIHQTNAVGAF